jgi:ribonucleoside-diphosphate reductase beta chain
MSAAASGRVFTTTSPHGLQYDLPPMRLWEKAKRLGIWNPRDIDFSQDVVDWQGMSEDQRTGLARQSSLFLAGEESVTLDLLPLIMVIAREGRTEEEMYLTSFLWEEAKHVDGFRRFFDEVVQDHTDLSRYHGPSYRRIFYEELPSAMNRLLTDSSPVAQVRASATYNMIVEGVLAETGYYSYGRSLNENNLLPGMQQFIGLLKRDESRHIAFAVYFLSRLMAEHGDIVWEAFQERMNELLPLTLGVVNDGYEAMEAENMAFNVEREEILAYAMTQFQKRMDRIGRARHQTLEEVYRVANTLDEAEA